MLCRSCIENIEFVSSERIENEFIRKFFSDNVITDFVSSFLFIEGSVVQKLIHSLKYDQNFQAGNLICKLIYDRLSSRLKEWKADMIIPVPLHSLRRAERGYNQAKEISKGISRLAGIPCNSKILRREKYTRTQTKFTLSQRKKNISGAFSIKRTNCIKGKRIIIVDDVITTGATITECASLLKKNKAAELFALSAAVAN